MKLKKIQYLTLVLIIAAKFIHIEAATSATASFQPLPSIERNWPTPINQAPESKGLLEYIKEYGLKSGFQKWRQAPQIIKPETRSLLKERVNANQIIRKTEQKLEQETDPDKVAWLTAKLDAARKFLVENKIALGALGSALAIGTAATYTAEESAHKSHDPLLSEAESEEELQRRQRLEEVHAKMRKDKEWADEQRRIRKEERQQQKLIEKQAQATFARWNEEAYS